MADIQVYFNRPDRPYDRKELLADICSARKGIAIASAWFTDTDLAEAMLASNAGLILAIFSRIDLKRDNGCQVYRMLSAVARTDKRLAVKVLGGDDWREGTMHHKLIAIDRRLVWCGSWNYTYQARSNWESLFRIEDAALNLAVWKELIQIAGVRILQAADGSQVWRAPVPVADPVTVASLGSPVEAGPDETGTTDEDWEFSCWDCGKVQSHRLAAILGGYGDGQCLDCERNVGRVYVTGAGIDPFDKE